MPIVSRVAAGLALVAVASGDAGACSFASFHYRSVPARVHLVGVATPDTVAAGPATGIPGDDVRAGPRAARPPYGQVIEVRQLAANAPPELRDALAGGRVVVVPWGYDVDCSRLPWSGSARWTRPGVEALFTAVLRDREYWLSGLPTLDVTVTRDAPYVGRPARGPWADAGGGAPWLSPAELLRVYERLPRDAPQGELAREAEPLFQWARENPDLAARMPASEVLREVRRAMARRQVPRGGA